MAYCVPVRVPVLDDLPLLTNSDFFVQTLAFFRQYNYLQYFCCMFLSFLFCFDLGNLSLDQSEIMYIILRVFRLEVPSTMFTLHMVPVSNHIRMYVEVAVNSKEENSLRLCLSQ
jgi:hypothetical protein